MDSDPGAIVPDPGVQDRGVENAWEEELESQRDVSATVTSSPPSERSLSMTRRSFEEQ